MKKIIFITSLLCISYAPIMLSSAPVKIKMFKTDQSTWGKRWEYSFSHNSNRSGFPKHTIKKEVTASIDPSQGVYLHVMVPTGPGRVIRGTAFDITPAAEEKAKGNVIALDKYGNARFQKLEDVKAAIEKTAPPKIKTIDVYRKNISDGKPWTLKSINTDTRGYYVITPENTYGTTKIKRDTTGLNTSKLKFPFKKHWILMVDKGDGIPIKTIFTEDDDNINSQEFDKVLKAQHIQGYSVLVLDLTGKAEIIHKDELKDHVLWLQ